MQRIKRLLLSVHICNTGTVGSSLFGIQIIAESLFYPFECSRMSGVRSREVFLEKISIKSANYRHCFTNRAKNLTLFSYANSYACVHVLPGFVLQISGTRNSIGTRTVSSPDSDQVQGSFRTPNRFRYSSSNGIKLGTISDYEFMIGPRSGILDRFHHR